MIQDPCQDRSDLPSLEANDIRTKPYPGTMKTFRLYLIVFICLPLLGAAQNRCASADYQQQQVRLQPQLSERLSSLENWIQQAATTQSFERTQEGTLVIPVVFHNLYHLPSERISDQQVQDQLKSLNECFRMRNPDTANTRPVFKPLAADCEIEFRLAISDPRRRATTGIVRQYTPISSWKMGDDMKFSSKMGADGWDSRGYLNIWVCRMEKFAGFSSVLGADAKLDGIVLDLGAIGGGHKTLVHEVGHWLGLKHLWGDEYCGDDGVSDTPKQASYTMGCPSTIRITCGNNPTGDMYNNYMDFTSDACMTLFTEGQKSRMRSLLKSGGLRASLMQSVGLKIPLTAEMPVVEPDPTWLEPKLYPTTVTHLLQIDLSYDRRWVGQTYRIIDLQGRVRQQGNFQSTIHRFPTEGLEKGYYLLEARRTDGLVYQSKFLKL